MKNKKQTKSSYWYKTTITECVLCGAGTKTKTRMYSKKPTDPRDTYEFIQFGCGEHFI